MKFRVSRTSDSERQPCDEAVAEMIPKWDTRSFRSEQEYDDRFAGSNQGSWRSKGTDHHITERGEISRRLSDQRAWMIEIDSLDALAEFAKKHDRIVVETDWKQADMLLIEIYDNSRE